MKHLIFIITLFIFYACSTEHEAYDPVQLVNPLVGTGGHGHTFPGATVPFGMVQCSPDTRLDGWDGCSGYHYSDSVIYGFSHTHLSGTGVSDYGDILLMPASGPVQFSNGYGAVSGLGYGSLFSKSSEKASPGYYAVHLDAHHIDVELTATCRAAMHRYNLPENDLHVIIDLDHRDKLLDWQLIQVSDTEIAGYRISEAWAREQHVYFVAQFSEPITKTDFFRESESQPQPSKAAIHFENTKELLVKVGISAVSVENARANLLTEIPDFDFDKVHADARAEWGKSLSAIEVEGGTEVSRAVFYTALYHTMLAPNLFSDSDGRYRGMDGEVHHADHPVYTVFSLWDTFRALHPLFTIVERERTEHFLRTFLLHHAQGGRLPVWELAGNETDCMIGYHSVSVVADAYAKGIRNFDTKAMLDAMVHTSSLDHYGLESYRKHGYIQASHDHESVSKTLEYAYDDWCIATFAHAIGDTAVNRVCMERAQHYKNLFDPQTGFFRAKMDGGWFGPFDPAEVNFNYTEANAWQYSTFVPHDISGLMALHGGPDSLEAHLDRLFSASSQTTGREQADITGLVGQYAHGNEPSHHMAYIYNYTGSPWKTQELVRKIMSELYSNNPEGLSGNEDCGQMSAWYVLSAMGFYPVTPGTTTYALGSPVFDKVHLHLESGKTFTITATNNSDGNVYVQGASLNGRDLAQSWISHDDILGGGALAFDMGGVPNKEWAREAAHRPSVSINAKPIASVPFFESEGPVFTNETTVEIGNADGNAILFVSINGADFEEYTHPLILKATTEMASYAVLPDGARSKDLHGHWLKIDDSRQIALGMNYSNQYNAGGDNALIDRLRGSDNFLTGRWQGYQDQNFLAVVDLGSPQMIRNAGVGFLQDIKSWIWFPKEVLIETSVDGDSWKTAGVASHGIPADQFGTITYDFKVPVHAKIQYLRVSAPNFGPCPEWHLGAGGASWLFADEIWVE